MTLTDVLRLVDALPLQHDPHCGPWRAASVGTNCCRFGSIVADLSRAVEQLAVGERERCAKVCEQRASGWGREAACTGEPNVAVRLGAATQAANKCAAAIRALKTEA